MNARKNRSAGWSRRNARKLAAAGLMATAMVAIGGAAPGCSSQSPAEDSAKVQSSALTFFPDSHCAQELANGLWNVSYDLCQQEIQLPTAEPLPFLEQVRFLFEPPTSGQFELQPGKLDVSQLAVITGDIALTGELKTVQVEAQENQLGGVHGDYGYTLRDVWSGRFFYVVNGGHPIRMRFTAIDVGPSSGAPEYLPVERVVNPEPGKFTTIPTVAMVPATPPMMTPVTPSNPSWAYVESAMEQDSSGERSATVFIPANTDWLVSGNALTSGSGTLEAGVQEYTVGDGEAGAQRMPAALPAASAYTYAAELVAHLDGLPIDPTFSQPVYVYVDNFLDFPVGDTVPNGTYDRDTGAWVQHREPEGAPLNGIVVQFVDIKDGYMEVDTGGVDVGLTDDERYQLAQRYSDPQDIGKTFWRMPVLHFSAWDFNLGWTPPLNAGQPPDPREDDREGLSPDSCVMNGSTIECESSVLGEEIPITGAPYSLVYRSSRVPGYKPAHRRTLKIPGGGQNVLPDTAKKLVADLEVAGVKIHQEKDKPSSGWGTDESFTFDWNGQDAFGRDLNGIQKATVHVGAVYQGVYGKTDGFGLPPVGQYQTNDTRQEVTYWTTWRGDIGFLDARAFHNGGWTISHQHVYDRNTQTIHYGDGRWRRGSALGQILQHECEGCSIGSYPYGMDFDPNGVLYFIDRTGGASGDGTLKKLENGVVTNVVSVPGGPIDVRVAPNGTVYVAQPDDGLVSKMVGTQWESVTSVPLSQPSGIALAPDGTLFVSDTGHHQIWRVGTDGSSTLFAGNGTAGSSGDEGPAIQAQLRAPLGIDVADDGSVFFVDLNGLNGVDGSIRRVDPSGIIHLVAGGDGNTNDSSEGIDATTAKLNAPQNVRIGSDGNAYLTEGTGTNGHGGRVRKITSIGRIVTVAGDGLSAGGVQCDDGPATTVHLAAAQGLAFAPDGTLWVSQHGNNSCDAIRRIAPALPGAAVGTQLVPSEDGSEVYAFNEFGRHMMTYDAVLGTPKFKFVYHPYETAEGHSEPLLDEIDDVRGSEDALGLQTFFDRTPYGELYRIRAPFYASGNATTDVAIEEGWLMVVSGPVSQYSLAYKQQALGGLLEEFNDPKGGTHSFAYNDDGRLTTDRDPRTQTSAPYRKLAGVQEVTGGNVTGSGIEITTANGLKHKFTGSYPSTLGITQRTITRPDGTSVHAAISREAGARLATYPDGSSRLALLEPDPRFGLAAGTTHELLELPGGNKKLGVNVDREVVGAVPGSPFSFTSLSETRTVYPDPADPSTNIQYTSTFHKNENRIEVTSPEGRSVSQYLDSYGRVWKERPGPGTPEVADVIYGYDSYGRLTTVDQGSRRVKYGYDPNTGFLETISVGPTSEAWLLQTTFDRNDDGYVTKATDYQSFSTIFDRDEMGDAYKIRTQAGTGGSASYYDHNQPLDPVGLLQSYTPPPVAGQPAGTVGYDYDLDRRPTLVGWADGRSLSPQYDPTSGKLTEIRDEANQVLRQFAYDTTTGNITSATCNGMTTGFGYDGYGAIADRVSTTWPGSPAKDVSLEYDGYLRPNKEKLTGGADVTYTLDDDGLVTAAAISSPGTTFHLSDRSPQSGRLESTWIGNVTTAIQYDQTYADVTHVATTFTGNTNRYNITYAPDAIGRVQVKTEQVEANPSTDETYDYWPSGWLKSVDDGTTTTQWDYDPRGNRTKENGVTIASYDARDRILTYNTASTGSLSFQYDADGRRSVRKLSGTQTHSYTWDRFGLLTSVTMGTTTINYTLDALGRRVTRKKYVSGVLQAEERYLYSGDNRLVATLNGNGGVTARFIYATGSHTPDLMVKGGTVYRIVTDQLGSPRAVINVVNGNQDVYKHGVWGKETAAPAPSARIPFGFAGGLYDADTKLVHFGARDYDPEVGRWISPDPIRFDGGTNLYAYANGDPVNYVDLDGKNPLIFIAAAGFAEGFVMDAALQLALNGMSFQCVDWNHAAGMGAITGLYSVATAGVGMLAGAAVGLRALGRADDVFEIVDGVRRAKAAELLGKKSISARLGGSMDVIEIPLANLRSPNKSVIDAAGATNAKRFSSVLEGVRAGNTPPISVNAGSRGPSIFDVILKF